MLYICPATSSLDGRRKGLAKGAFRLSPLPLAEKGDILVIANQGCAGVSAEGLLGSVAKHFLKARRICQVKI